MIISHQVLQDTSQQHLAYLDFRAPFQLDESFQLPRKGRFWIWRVDFFDSQHDGVHDDVYIRGWHLKPPHLGEATNNVVTGHGYIRVDALDLGPHFSRNGHNKHFDTLSSAIRAAPASGRRLWIFLEHSKTARGTPGIPDIPDGGIVVPPTGGVVGGGFRPPGARARAGKPGSLSRKTR